MKRGNCSVRQWITCAASTAMASAASAAPLISSLGTLDNTLPRSEGFALNAGHQVVGDSSHNGPAQHAFFYTGGQMKDLGTLQNLDFSRAYSINDSGVIAGVSSNQGNSLSRAFYYSGVPGAGRFSSPNTSTRMPDVAAISRHHVRAHQC